MDAVHRAHDSETVAKGLTEKQRRFVEAYDGNATEAARKAGHVGTPESLAVTGSRLLKNAKVAEAIRLRGAKVSSKHIATREERQEFFTRTMLDEGVDFQHRLRAAELLGKSNGDFLDRLQVEGKLTLEQLVLGSLGKK